MGFRPKTEFGGIQYETEEETVIGSVVYVHGGLSAFCIGYGR